MELSFEEDCESFFVEARDGLGAEGFEGVVGKSLKRFDSFLDVGEIGLFLEGQKVPKGAFIPKVAEAGFQRMDGGGLEEVEAIEGDLFIDGLQVFF